MNRNQNKRNKYIMNNHNKQLEDEEKSLILKFNIFVFLSLFL